MKYFGHESVAQTDHRMKDVLSKYGPLGYGVYWILNERICQELCLPKGIDCLIVDRLDRLAEEFKMTVEKLVEMLDFFVEVGAFQKTPDGRYQNIKMLSRLDKHGKQKLRNQGITFDYEKISSEEIYQKLKEFYGLCPPTGHKLSSQVPVTGQLVAVLAPKRKETKRNEKKLNSNSNAIKPFTTKDKQKGDEVFDGNGKRAHSPVLDRI